MKKAFSLILSLIVALSALTALSFTAYANVTPITQNGVTYYIADNGRTSAVVQGNGITWLKDESYGYSVWYGIDNSQGLIEPGSIFWVVWLDVEDYNFYFYYDSLDNIPSDNKSSSSHIFMCDIVNPDGTEDIQVAKSVPIYI